jgi:hypothetical protein
MSITHMLWSEYPHRIVMTNTNIVTYKLGSEELAISSVVFPAFGKFGSRARDDVAGEFWFREIHHP